MNAKKLGNQSAYPGQAMDGIGQPLYAYGFGLTKREAFALAAMQGFCANADQQTCSASPRQTAEHSVLHADALLAELAKDQP